MKKILFALLLLISFNAIAQDNQFMSTGDSDPVSKKLLDKIKGKYEKVTAMEADFQLIIELPEEDPEIQKGHLRRGGNQFNVDINGQSIICDGSQVWIHQPSNNTVQINSFDPEAGDDEVLSPQNFMQFYDNGKFIAAPIVVAKENGISVRWIELKPVDPDSEYFKFRISIDIKKDEIKQIKAFSRDGSRFTLKIDKLTTGGKFDKNIFSFDKNKHPNIIIEDLRID